MYRKLLTKDRTLIAVAARDELYRFIEGDVESVSPQEDDGNGSISKFGRFSPVFRLGGERISGVSISHEFNPAARLTLAYLGGASSSNPQLGLFNDAYVALAQATLRPIQNLTLGLTYARSYSANLADENRIVMDFEVSSKAAINPFPDENGSAVRMNSYSIQAAYRFNPGFILSGCYSFYKVEQLALAGHKADITNWAVQATLPDFGGDGNMLGLTFGQPGKVTANDYSESNSRFPEPGFRGAEPNTAYHVEAFYRYALNDNIAVTPGFIYVINPENNKQNDNFWVGVVRTTFTF